MTCLFTTGPRALHVPVRERGEARDGGEHHAPQDRALAGRRAPAQQGWLDCLNEVAP